MKTFFSIVVASLAIVSCRSSVDVKSNRSAAQVDPAPVPPRGEPVEIPGSLGATRTDYQSRGVITLEVDASMLQLGDGFMLFNQTTGSELIYQDGPRSTLAGDSSIALRLYLLNPDIAQGFTAGENKLRLLVDPEADDGGRVSNTSITVRDFTTFGLTTGVFETGEQRAAGFEGGFQPFTKAVLTSKEQGLLVTGFSSIVNY